MLGFAFPSSGFPPGGNVTRFRQASKGQSSKTTGQRDLELSESMGRWSDPWGGGWWKINFEKNEKKKTPAFQFYCLVKKFGSF